MCIQPIKRDGAEFGCGRCMPCRINRQRLWTARLVLESLLHAESVFATLTYSKEGLPNPPQVLVEHGQLFVRALRDAGYSFRYYFVGEYGDKRKRPHYHAILFGLGMQHLPAIIKAWPHGYVKLGTCTPASCAYVAQYVTKKMTKAGDPRLGGLNPEFARMSLKPGLGADAMPRYAGLVVKENALLEETKDVPAAIRLAGKEYPIGRYLRDKLREAVGMPKGQSREAAEAAFAKRYAESQTPGYSSEIVRRRIYSKRRSEWLNNFNRGKGKL